MDRQEVMKIADQIIGVNTELGYIDTNEQFLLDDIDNSEEFREKLRAINEERTDSVEKLMSLIEYEKKLMQILEDIRASKRIVEASLGIVPGEPIEIEGTTLSDGTFINARSQTVSELQKEKNELLYEALVKYDDGEYPLEQYNKIRAAILKSYSLSDKQQEELEDACHTLEEATYKRHI